jgi:TIR domain
MSTAVGSSDGASVQKVFICYRREESAPYAGRLYDAMIARFGEGNVFMDLDLAPGVDFVERITQVVSGCLALIVVIGPKWATVEGEDGKRRIEDLADFVRLEVETGLGRSDVTPIPVLVAGARMPRRENLPSEIQPIARRNALELSEGRWGYDVGRLLDTLDELLPDGGGPATAAASSTPSPPAPLDRRLVLEGMLVAGATAAAARLLGYLIPPTHEKRLVREALKAGEETVDGESIGEAAVHTAGIVMRRVETFALLGGALAVWLAWRIWHMDPFRHLLRGLLVGALAGLIGGAVFGAAVFLPQKVVLLDDRNEIDLLASAVSGGIVGSLVGWFWRPRRIGPAILAGTFGGFLFQLVVVLASWEDRGAWPTVLRFALGAAAVTGLALTAMIAGSRAESREHQSASAGVAPP